MILAAHQPAYLPWLGFFHKIALSDTFCIVDTVRYSKYGFTNRNRIKTAKGTLWLTVPVHAHGRPAERICDVRIADNSWSRKHLSAITQSYARAPYLSTYLPGIAALLTKRYAFLSELNNDLLRLFLQVLRIDVNLVVASDYAFEGKKSDFALDMSRQLGATTLVFGSHGRDYAKVASFERAGIEVYFQNYRHPVYRQQYWRFVPNLSIIDLLFNEGPRSLEVIFSGNVRSLDERRVGSRQT